MANSLLRQMPALGSHLIAAESRWIARFGPWCRLSGHSVVLREDRIAHLRLGAARHLEEHKQLIPCGNQMEVQG